MFIQCSFNKFTPIANILSLIKAFSVCLDYVVLFSSATIFTSVHSTWPLVEWNQMCQYVVTNMHIIHVELFMQYTCSCLVKKLQEQREQEQEGSEELLECLMSNPKPWYRNKAAMSVMPSPSCKLYSITECKPNHKQGWCITSRLLIHLASITLYHFLTQCANLVMSLSYSQ